MPEWYPALRSIHIAAVILSGGLFFLRGLGILAGAGWPMARPLRLFGHGVDTILLAAALMLAALIGQYPFVQGWLTAKVLLLVVYIVLGSVALKRGKTRAMRAGCFADALLVYGFIVGIAAAHHPLGILAGVFG